jgi:RHS repeat-associated protein
MYNTQKTYFTNIAPPSTYVFGQKKTSDYYPFGMQMQGRKKDYTSSTYRFGFQNQENDNEIKGNGNSVNYRYRMHDPRLGRFFAIDPLASKYPHNSPYAFSENRVIDGVELEGCEYISIHVRIKNDGSMERIKVVDHREVMTENQVMKVHGMTKDKFYEKHSQTYEGKGPGVLYVYYRVDKNGSDSLIGEHMEMDRSIAEYGLYQGGGCVSLYGGNDDNNPFVSNDKFTPDYSFEPNDSQDFNAKMHDMDQERLTDVKSHKDPRTLKTDERFMQNLYRDKQNMTDKNWVDPFTGRKPSEDVGRALNRAILWFSMFEMPQKQKEYGLPVRYVPIYDDGIYNENDKNIPEDVL